MITSFFNILAVCAAAGFAGVMLSIGVTLGGFWRTLPPAEFLSWFETYNGYVAKAVPIIVLPALIGIVGSLIAGWNTEARIWWILSLTFFIAVLILTAVYFVPSNTAFASGSFDVNAVSDKLKQWVSIHYVRIALAFTSGAFGCWALRVSGQS